MEMNVTNTSHFHHSSRRSGRSGQSGRPGQPGSSVLVGGDYLVSFDISSDRSRRAVGKALERFGPKLLYSVYGITVPARRLPRLLTRIDGLLEPSDHALVLPVCDHCDEAWWGLPLDTIPRGGWVAR
jgi:CRISPR-associated endonuclease Cas2